MSDFPPVQLEIRTPFEPTPFPGAGRTHLIYELHLRNFASAPLAIRGIDVIDAKDTAGEPVAHFEGKQLDGLLRPIGGDPAATDAGGRRQLAGGQSSVAFLHLAFQRGARVPDRLRHRVLLNGSMAEGPVIGTAHTRLRVLGPPVTGADWIADGGPATHSHHRVGLVVADGRAQISRRYAIDWKQIKNGATFSGDEGDVRAHHAYGKEVLAVADGTIVTAIDGLPDNVPRTAAGFDTAVPITMETVAGNALVLDLGGGQFVYYAHLQPGSLQVKAGDRVRRGQRLARIGNSGDSRRPHLHFQVATTPKLLASEGVPYLIDRYQMRSADERWETRTREFPMSDGLINFGRV